MNEVLQTIFRRRSIRKFTDQPVDDESLTLLLEAAMSAPTASNSQPWEFIVITKPETLDRIRGKLHFAKYNAPAAIVVCGNPSIANNSSGKRYWEQDCSAATENILIAATSLGLGTVWIGIHPLPSVIKLICEMLDIPEHVTPLSMVYVGYPAEEKTARTQYDQHRVYWQKYEPRKRKPRIKNAKKL
jgi:nitroreductase